MGRFTKGNNFVHKKTGSATMINLDGREHDFVDSDAIADKKNKIKPKKQTRLASRPKNK